MKKRFICLIIFIFFIYSFCQAQEKMPAALAPMGALGTISKTEKQIIFNSLQESLSTYYLLASQKSFEKAQDQAFEELDYEECTEDQCFALIQQILQVDNLFLFNLTREESFTQLSLTRVDLDSQRLVRTILCKDCDIGTLNTKVDELVLKIFKEDTNTDGLSIFNEKESESSFQQPSILKGKVMYVPRDFFKHVVEYRGHTYALTRYRYTFQGAQNMAERFGGHLVTVDDHGENLMLLREYQTKHGDHGVWIGFSDREKEGTFVWNDGTSKGLFVYSNWGKHEPNNWKNKEDCTELRFKSWNIQHMPVGGWNDVDCSHSFLAFIEWDAIGLKQDLSEAKKYPLEPVEQLDSSGFGMGWKLGAMAFTLGAGLSSLNQAKAYNDLASKNKSLREQYSKANTVEERNTLESEYSNNQKQMNAAKSTIRTLDGVTLAGLLALAYMYASEDDDPVKVVSENNFIKPRNSGLQFSLLENHMHLGWQWNF